MQNISSGIRRFKRVQRCTRASREHPKRSQEHTKRPQQHPKVPQEHSKSIPRAYQEHTKSIPRASQDHPKSIPRMHKVALGDKIQLDFVGPPSLC